jgi:DNA invertase Pin-like site-specific DNA recombinase
MLNYFVIGDVEMSETQSFVCYLRVSTTKQSNSGLGLESQKQIVNDYLKSVNGTLIGEFIETESGKRNDRVELEEAIRLTTKTKSKLLIAKLDRFIRKVSFISSLMDKGVGFVIAEMPNATPFQIHIHSAMAEEEGRLISVRTSNALQMAKKRGVKLGKNGKVLAKQNKQNANRFAKTLKRELVTLIDLGFGYSQIAREFNRLGIPTFTGKKWYPQTVKNVLKRLDLLI